MTITTELTAALQAAMAKALGEAYASCDPQVQSATRPEFGDFQANFAMTLAKQCRQSPFDLASAVAAEIHAPELIKTVSVVKPGFINLCVTDMALIAQVKQLAAPRFGIPQMSATETIVVDYGGPNAAKAMHVGHLRSAIIGDAIYRILAFLGYHVIRQNHVGDWGTQFGMLIEYMQEQQHLGNMQAIDDLNAWYQLAKAQFDKDPEFAVRAKTRVSLLQQGDAQTRAIWEHIIAISIEHFQAIYQRLKVHLQPQDVRGESFYNSQLTSLVEELAHLGLVQESDGAKVIFLAHYFDENKKPVPFLVQKSDGAYLYATTDLAAAAYRIQKLHAKRIIYVTDARQAQHFAMLFDTLKQVPWAQDVCLQHVPFGAILGEDKKPFKTRAGDVIKLAFLLEEAHGHAKAMAQSKNPALSDDEAEAIAEVIGIGALKFADLVNDKVKDYVFDWDKMLAFEGKTAPYLINAYVRIQSIFRKANIDIHANKINWVLTEDSERKLILKLLGFASTILIVAEDLSLHKLCHYLYDLASSYHHFYEHCPILSAATDEQKQTRLALSQKTADVLKLGLQLLGIEVLEKM